MNLPTGHFHWRGSLLVLQVYLQAGASRSEWAGLHNGKIKIRLPALQVEGKANRQLLAFIASEFGVRQASVNLAKGTTNRHKTIEILEPAGIPTASLVEKPVN